VALRVDAPWDGEAQQFVFCVPSKHHRADLHRTDACVAVDLDRQRLRRKLLLRNVRQHAHGVDVNGVATGRFDNRDAVIGDVTAEIIGGSDTIAQVIRVQDFCKADGDGLQIAAGQPTVSRETFGKDQEIRLLDRQAVVIRAQEAANVGESIFLGGERTAVGIREHFLGDLLRTLLGVAWLVLRDKPGVFGETTGV